MSHIWPIYPGLLYLELWPISNLIWGCRCVHARGSLQPVVAMVTVGGGRWCYVCIERELLHSCITHFITSLCVCVTSTWTCCTSCLPLAASLKCILGSVLLSIHPFASSFASSSSSSSSSIALLNYLARRPRGKQWRWRRDVVTQQRPAFWREGAAREGGRKFVFRWMPVSWDSKSSGRWGTATCTGDSPTPGEERRPTRRTRRGERRCLRMPGDKW